jgi:hypothetical protein
MTAPWRYRLALAAYPARYRAERGRELLSTLADGDDDRGRPSTREAVALAYRGLLERSRMAATPDGLLVIAAALVLFTAFAGLTWAERLYLFRGEVGIRSTEVVDMWAGTALVASAVAVVAAVAFGSADNARRRRFAALVAFVAVPILWVSPGEVFKYSIPDAGQLWDYFVGIFPAIFRNHEVVLPPAAAAAAGTWVALWALGRLSPETRRRVLAAALCAAGTVAVALTVTRPDLPTPGPRDAVEGYARDAFSDLGAAAFVTVASVLLALVAAIATRRERHGLLSDSAGR